MKVAQGGDLVRIPRLWAVVMAVGTPVVIGLAVFFRRYRGADRTAMALSLLVGGGLCLTMGLAWFQSRFGRTVMRRGALRWVGLRYGAAGGILAGAIGVALLAARWAMDQLASPAGTPFVAAFWRALAALGRHLAAGAAAYLAAGALVGALIGLLIAEMVGLSGDRVAGPEQPLPAGPEPAAPSRAERAGRASQARR